MKYFPQTSEDIQQMLKCVGVNSLDELYSEVPKELLFKELIFDEIYFNTITIPPEQLSNFQT